MAKGVTVRKQHPTNPDTVGSVSYGIKRPHTLNKLKGVVIVQDDADNLMALLDAGKIEEFRRLLYASRLKRRKLMVARVMSGR